MRNRDGFTMVEIMLAVLLLSFVIMGFQAVTGEIIHFSAKSARYSAAVQLVEDQLELIRMHPTYADLDSTFEGTESSISGHPGLARVTTVNSASDTIMGTVVTYTKVMVTVLGDGLESGVSRSISIAAP